MNKGNIIIIGGGPAGLTAAIHLAKKGCECLLIEKKEYPHHKVCGEYLSREILPYFSQLGIEILEENPPEISRLAYSTLSGKRIEAALPMGGVGISRYRLDDLLYKKALEEGVTVIHQRVIEIKQERMGFIAETSEGTYEAEFLLGAYGKRALLDKKLERKFVEQPAPWVAIKNHYRLDKFPADLVELHNFKGGYCGLSKTETGAINVCYLASYRSFKKYKDPEVFQKEVLRKNPFLDRFFARAQPLFDKPLSIAQISFHKKTAVEGNLLMLGDAAGLIHPLCGNGMAMAIRSGRIAAEEILKKPGARQLQQRYKERWHKEFGLRLKVGKVLQGILIRDRLAEFSQYVLSQFPAMMPRIITLTHGRQT